MLTRVWDFQSVRVLCTARPRNVIWEREVYKAGGSPPSAGSVVNIWRPTADTPGPVHALLQAPAARSPRTDTHTRVTCGRESRWIPSGNMVR
jgi:hypothetical protein